MTEVDSDELLYQQEGKEFRLNALKAFLTYPQCEDLTWTDVLTKLREFGGGIDQFAISSEVHADGGNHIHCFVKWIKKVNIVHPRSLDVKGFHPNIRRVKNVQGCVEYVIKYGNFETQKLELWPNSTNFQKRKADFESWLIFKQHHYLKKVEFPIALPQGLGEIAKPKPWIKKRHVWIVGPPNCGKTKWMNDTFRNTKVYLRPAGVAYPYEGYNNEEIVIYDDVKMWDLLEELKSVTNTWDVPTHVYGPTRYHRLYWQLGQSRTVIVLTNELPEYHMMPAFNARFNIYHMKVPDEDAATPVLVYESPPIDFNYNSD